MVKKDKKSDGVEFFKQEEIQKVLNFHRSFEQYNETPLVSLKNLAEMLGVGGIYVKDESYRFGLNSFKVLGGSYAIGKCLAKKLGEPIENITFEKLKSDHVKQKLGQITFTSATDGNHGKGVAWTARQLGHKAVIYLPKGSTQARLNHIKEAGAEAYITESNYDDCVKLAAENARKYGWEMIQDTAWEGYDEIPVYVMQGYATMALEALKQLNGYNVERPTHIFLQAGVGAFAGAMLGFFNSVLEGEIPKCVIAEPNAADCIYKSAQAGDIRKVEGDMDTIMAGLACGEPNPLGWKILKEQADMFVSLPDNITARGMRILGNPLKGDAPVVSGESGAVTLGLLSVILQNKSLKQLKEELKLDKNSQILLFSTEGDTDPNVYRQIVWDGAYPYI